MDINQTLNELLVGLFHDIMTIEEKAIRKGPFKEVTVNDMHVIEAIGIEKSKNMSTVAKALGVTMGTLTISVNSLVKKGFVERSRSEEDRRVVLISLTAEGKKAFLYHQQFHEDMIQSIVGQLDADEKKVLQKTLSNLNIFFKEQNS
ncbi:MAG: MarR family transcriptional regulator [Lachnospiraceae bacterium]|nr:MarR family transcriptional regulator [Eubacterium sp.]MBO5242126.1 MarR family transcriptional regulator [Lachnospiraceae bacterium]